VESAILELFLQPLRAHSRWLVVCKLRKLVAKTHAKHTTRGGEKKVRKSKQYLLGITRERERGTHTQTYLHERTYTYMHTYIHTHTHTHTHTHPHRCTYSHTFTHIHTYTRNTVCTHADETHTDVCTHTLKIVTFHYGSLRTHSNGTLSSMAVQLPESELTDCVTMSSYEQWFRTNFTRRVSSSGVHFTVGGRVEVPAREEVGQTQPEEGEQE
jgi:hypothetical protein